MRGKPVGIVRDQTTGLFSQGTSKPDFKAPTKSRASGASEPDKLNKAMEKCSCMVHGIDAKWVESTLKNGALCSGYALRGPTGKYSRDADRNGGGATAVYTRAVGTDQTKWKANGFGVGSNDARVQLVLSPEILEKPDHVWRASTMDGMGKVPGVTKTIIRAVNNSQTKLDGFNAWEQQTEKDRNYQFESVTKGKMMENNEQLHWEKVPLPETLAAVVCSSSAMKTLEPICQTNAAGEKVIAYAGREIPVIVANKSDNLIDKLKENGVTNAKNQVRLSS